MEEIQTKRRGEWRTICTARGRVAEEGSHDAIEVFYALRKGAPLTFHDIRLVDEKGRVVAGGDEEEQDGSAANQAACSDDVPDNRAHGAGRGGSGAISNDC